MQEGPIEISDLKINCANENLLSGVDLHLHTYWSDGTLAPSELIRQMAARPYKLISITDHNSIEAYNREIFDECQKLNVNLLPGVEMDCGLGVDILVYDKKPNEMSKEFKEEFFKITKRENLRRVTVAKRCLKEIKEYFGLKEENWLTVENLLKVNLKSGEFNLERTYVSKPHIAKLLEISELLKDKFDNLKDIYKFVFKNIVKWDYDYGEINRDLIEEIRKLGFTMILAHPGKTVADVYKKDNISRNLFEKFLREIILDYKLDGAEVDYRKYGNTEIDFNRITRDFLINIKNRRTYFGTAGSDNH